MIALATIQLIVFDMCKSGMTLQGGAVTSSGLQDLCANCVEGRNDLAHVGLLVSLEKGMTKCNDALKLYLSFRWEHPYLWYSIKWFSFLKRRMYFY